MGNFQNRLGQSMGFPLPDWQPRDHPPATPMQGRYCRVEPLDINAHAADLHQANREDAEDRIWTYLPYGPFATLAAYRDWLDAECLGTDPRFHAIVDLRSSRAVGLASYLRITPLVGVIEVGHINYSPPLQRSTAATEAMYLLMSRVFDELGYRRYEWKCDVLNVRSRRAAERLGFVFEGVFRQATIYKGRNRDTAWYAILDREWPALRMAYQRWLDGSNFETDGKPGRRLQDFIAEEKSKLDRVSRGC